MATYGDWLNSNSGGYPTWAAQIPSASDWVNSAMTQNAQGRIGAPSSMGGFGSLFSGMGGGMGGTGGFGGFGGAGGGMGGMGGGGWVGMMMKGLGNAANAWAAGMPDKAELIQHTISKNQEKLIADIRDMVRNAGNTGMAKVGEYEKNVAANTPLMNQWTKDLASKLFGEVSSQANSPENIYSYLNNMFMGNVNSATPAITESGRRAVTRANLLSGRPTGATSSYDQRLAGNVAAQNLMPAIIAAMSATNTGAPTWAAMLQNRLGNLAAAPGNLSGMLGVAESRPFAGYDQTMNVIANLMNQAGGVDGLKKLNTILEMRKKFDPLKTAVQATGAALSSAG